MKISHYIQTPVQLAKLNFIITNTSRKHGEKNRSRFPSAVLLTTMVCSHQTTTNFIFHFATDKIKCFGACDIRLGMQSHGIPSPTHVSMSRFGGKVSPKENTCIILIIIKLDIYSRDLELRVESSFLLDPTLNTSPKSHVQKVLSCRHPCHIWDIWQETRVNRP